jgi:hypothetical protein
MVIKHEKYNLSMIISGGQTGADRAALDFALSVGMACSLVSEGPVKDSISFAFPLLRLNQFVYAQTRLNVRESLQHDFFSEKYPEAQFLTSRCCMFKESLQFYIFD